MQVSACASCHAKGTCSAANQDEKLIDVESNDHSFSVGQLVNITGSATLGLLAVLLAFVLPFILILVSLLVLSNFQITETVAGMLSLSLLIPYFVVLALFNKYLKRKLKFNIEHLVA